MNNTKTILACAIKLAENAVRAYDLINSVIRARTPRFISYEELKQMVLRGEPNEFI